LAVITPLAANSNVMQHQSFQAPLIGLGRVWNKRELCLISYRLVGREPPIPRNRARMPINPTALLDVKGPKTFSKKKIAKNVRLRRRLGMFKSKQTKKKGRNMRENVQNKVHAQLLPEKKYIYCTLSYWPLILNLFRWSRKKKNYKTKRRFEIVRNISKVLHVCSQCSNSWWWSRPTGHLVLLRNWMVYLSSTSRWERLRFIRWPTFLSAYSAFCLVIIIKLFFEFLVIQEVWRTSLTLQVPRRIRNDDNISFLMSK